jgi:hypothetical protein
MMSHLAGDATISLEGDLRHCSFDASLEVHPSETPEIKRSTSYPVQDFAVFRLSDETVEPIYKQVIAAGLSRAIIHVEIRRHGVLHLGAYDNFHPDCVTTGPAVPTAFLAALISEGLIRSYKPLI